VSTLPRPGCPRREFVVCTPLESGCPDSESVRYPIHRQVSFAMNDSAFRFPDPRSTLRRPVSQTTQRAPSMDPEAMKPVRARGCPRDRTNLTARVGPYSKSISPTGCPTEDTDLRHESPAP
jgi:hypothetical protein